MALLSDCYLPRLGGIEVQTHDLARELLRQGHEVEVFTATVGPGGERHGEVTVVDVATTSPSPFARSLLYGYVAQFVYEGDSPIA